MYMYMSWQQKDNLKNVCMHVFGQYTARWLDTVFYESTFSLMIEFKADQSLEALSFPRR